jgi:hydroxyquinol 1,2-dioxygenase
VLTALVRHLHDFAREVALTEGELMQGIEFLTATGQICTDRRQEFILLSDTLGLSMLTVALNHQTSSAQTTESTVFGPFHVEGAPQYPLGGDVANGASGAPLWFEGTVRGPRGEAIANAVVDVWQSDDAGFYDVQRDNLDHAQGRGVLHTDQEGRLYFRSVLPSAYPVPTDGPVGKLLEATGRHPWRPAHIHFRIQAPGYRTLVTHVFREGDSYLDSDVVFGVRNSLIGHFDHHAEGTAPDGRTAAPFYTLHFDFILDAA